MSSANNGLVCRRETPNGFGFLQALKRFCHTPRNGNRSGYIFDGYYPVYRLCVAYWSAVFLSASRFLDFTRFNISAQAQNSFSVIHYIAAIKQSRLTISLCFIVDRPTVRFCCFPMGLLISPKFVTYLSLHVYLAWGVSSAVTRPIRDWTRPKLRFSYA